MVGRCGWDGVVGLLWLGWWLGHSCSVRVRAIALGLGIGHLR